MVSDIKTFKASGQERDNIRESRRTRLLVQKFVAAKHLVFLDELSEKTIRSLTLQSGDIVIMHNLSAHKFLDVAWRIKEKRGDASCPLTCGLDLNPLGKMWSTVK